VYKILERLVYQSMSTTCKRKELVKSNGHKTACDYYLVNIERSITIVLEASRQEKILKKGAASCIGGMREACFARLICAC
jgi:hypothetical protein